MKLQKRQANLDRRNITEEQRSYLRGKRYTSEKKAQHRPVKRDQNDPVNPARTAEKLSQVFEVSAPTIKRDEKFSQGVDIIAQIEPEAKQEILSGKSILTKQEVQTSPRIY